jgi:SAM-dependent methyltransferase
MTLSSRTLDLLRHLASRPGHDEVKADFRSLLVEEFGAELGALDFERRVPEVRGRLDALIGRTVFEAKRNLDLEWQDVERRMPDYLADREREECEHFIGIASDGLKWAVFELRDEMLITVKQTTLDPDKPDAFLAWLDGVVALKASLPPDPLTIRAELGGDSVAFHLVREALTTLWARLSLEPAEVLKRQLWGDLLKQVYGREIEGDTLWLQHTYLVVVAKCIAVAVMDLREDDPVRLLSGEAFASAGITGAVESDFFDWVVADPEGIALVRRLMVHVRRFRLREVESDVLKILYEELIDRDERHGLGEYYTPDWLAAKIVRHAVTAPLEQRVLDPACGSGTFLFHALRKVLAEAEEAGMPSAERAREAVALVAGIDIHPVAVIIARVTYLLGLAPALVNRSGALSIPVYLGDSMQLGVARTLTQTELEIRVPPPPAGAVPTPGRGGRDVLSFPDTFCRDPGLFDKAIERMRTGSLSELKRERIEEALKLITEQHYKADLTEEQNQAISDLGRTYETFDRLRREGRDTIWAYVARNLSRPLALAAGGGWANVLVGNPPWLAFRHMTEALQKRFKELAKGEKIYVGRIPSQNDLCALFTVRASHLYLRPSGRIAFVLPLAALTRGQFDKMRSGKFGSYNIAWDEAWTMDDRVYPLFPVPSCVVFGRKRGIARAMPDVVKSYRGSLPYRDAPESIADKRLTVVDNAPAPAKAMAEGGSIYRQAFRSGAVLYPRLFISVERATSGRLGTDQSAPLFRSRRVSLEKEPWRSVAGIEGQVEAQFVRSMLLGESIAPYRLMTSFEAAIPVLDDGEVLSIQRARELGFDHLAERLTRIEEQWVEHGRGRYSFSEHLDYMRQLSGQFPLAPLRIVYAKAGILPAACVIRNPRAIVENRLYWAAPEGEGEAHYLATILNSEVARGLAAGFQSRGQFGARDFDKVMFNLPIPKFDAKNALHRALAEAGAHAEQVAALVELSEAEHFTRNRKRVRNTLAEEGVGGEIEKLVEKLLDVS